LQNWHTNGPLLVAKTKENGLFKLVIGIYKLALGFKFLHLKLVPIAMMEVLNFFQDDSRYLLTRYQELNPSAQDEISVWLIAQYDPWKVALILESSTPMLF